MEVKLGIEPLKGLLYHHKFLLQNLYTTMDETMWTSHPVDLLDFMLLDRVPSLGLPHDIRIHDTFAAP